ncbi:MAG: DUF308 domain-containing protein [Candidatus Paceibacterota bacterium]|jgi:uncharacterized membrane protein HdeD (DUF308 family)
MINIFDNYIRRVSNNWWIVFITGLVAVSLGVSFIIWPLEAVKILVYFIGFIIIIIGLGYIKNSFKIKKIGGHYERIKEDIKSKFD